MNPRFIDVVDESLCQAYFAPENINVIDPSEAVGIAKKFRITIGTPKWPYQKTKGYFIPRDSVEQIWAQNEGVIKGLKIYFGENIESGKVTLELIIIGADANSNDYLVPVSGTLPANLVIGDARPCPINCGTKNVLNSD
jgi:hypothetical protein